MQEKQVKKEIRNVAVLGHYSHGKTTLVEALANFVGLTDRQGNIQDGTTISDANREEKLRHFSIMTSIVPFVWKDVHFNFIDTPGLIDFGGEVVEGLAAADMALIVIDGRSGVESGTIRAWKYCERNQLPRLFFVTGVDDDRAKYKKTVEDLKTLFGKKIAPFQYPIKEGDRFLGFIDVVHKVAKKYEDTPPGYELIDMPNSCQDAVDAIDEMLKESVAETNENLMEKYFNDEDFTIEETEEALKKNVVDANIVPVLMGSGLRKRGMENLLLNMVIYFQSPNASVREILGEKKESGEMFVGDYDEDKIFSAYVFKTKVDPFIGQYSLIKICTGKLSPNTMVYNACTDVEEKIGKVYILRGNEPIEVDELVAGEIGAVAKLMNTNTGDTLSTREEPIVYERLQLPKPYTCMAYTADKRGDEDKISQALAKLMQEDQTLMVENDTENHQLLLYGIGKQHLAITMNRLLEEYKVAITLHQPKIKYRETIKKRVTVQGKYKKQSGGHGQYGDVKITLEPSYNLDEAYQFEEKIFGGAIPKNYFPAVEKGLQESVEAGPMAGYPVVGVLATLIDGSYHTVDSSELAFKQATIMAFKEGFMMASPVLLEPIMSVSVEVLNDYAGDVIGDLNKRRGRILGMQSLPHGEQKIEAEVPMMEIFDYATVLQSMTAGNGDFSFEFSRYEQAPEFIKEKVLSEQKK